jgi:divalent metal cation (Fe/Co/Zn/Cd) transporter
VDEDPAVEQVLNLVAVIVGSDRLMVALQVKFQEQPSGSALVEAINALERELHRRFPQIQHLFVEPDEA